MRRSRLRATTLVPLALLASLLAPGSALAAPAPPPSGTPAPPAPAGPAAPAPVEAGRPGWEVNAVTGGYRVRWTSPADLPITSDRPRIVRDGQPLGSARTFGRTVEVVVPGTDRPDTATLDVMLGQRRLDGAPFGGRSAQAAASVAAVAAPKRVYPVDPGKAGRYKTVSSDYDAGTLKHPGFDKLLNVRGHVVQPRPGQLSKRLPLVVFLHGRHDFCYSVKGGSDPAPKGAWHCAKGEKRVPSELGYVYLQQLLASQGYVTVSIDAAAINAMDYNAADGGAQARGLLVRRHLDLWRGWADAGRYPADLKRIVLVGHSRGGEGVNRAAQLIGEDAPYRIAGVVYLAPTNFAAQTIPYVPAVNVMPSCDGDVSDLQGQSYIDLARDVAPDDTALKASSLVIGANHNFFNTEWTPGLSKAPSIDDSDGTGSCRPGHGVRLSAKQQRVAGKAYVAGAVWLMTGRDARAAQLFDGTPGRVASVGDRPVYSQAVLGGRIMRRVGQEAAATKPAGATSKVCRALASSAKRDCPPREANSPHWPANWAQGEPYQQELFVRWTARGQRAGVTFAEVLSLSGSPYLDLRVIANPADGVPAISLRVKDAAGATVTVDPVGGRALPVFGSASSRLHPAYVAQTVRVASASLKGLNLGEIRSVEVVGRSAKGSLWLLDAAAVPASLPAPPARRMPTVALGDARATEGDGPGPGYAELPYAVSGRLLADATFTVRPVCTWQTACGGVVRATVPAGTQKGIVRLPFEQNDTWDGTKRWVVGSARAVSRIMPTDEIGEVAIAEDDPAPTLSVKPAASHIKEGQSAVWRISLEGKTSVGVNYRIVFVKPAKGTVAQIADLDRAWLTGIYGPGRKPSTPFAGEWTLQYATIDVSAPPQDFRVPTAKDRVRDPGEQLVLTIIPDDLPADGRRYPVVIR